MAERTVTTIWTGDVQNGEGRVTGQSDILSDVLVSLPTRTADAASNPSPEEYLAAAHSGCLAMNLSATLTQNGTPPEKLDVSSTVGFGPKDGGGFEIKYANVKIAGKVPGVTEEEFVKLAEKGEATCPISNAIRGNVDIAKEISFEG